MGEVSLQRSLSDVVAEYDHKLAGLREAISSFEQAGQDLSLAAAVGGSYGGNIDIGRVSENSLADRLLRSAWKHVYDGLNIERIASAADRKQFERELQTPPPFTLDNIRGTFGVYVADPRGNILRGLAEVFCALDPFYKSHDRVKIGVAGLPKRVILRNVDSYGWGREQLRDILSALAACDRKPLVEWSEIAAILADGKALYETRGVELRRFANGNGHLHFAPATLRVINLALAEYYGEVLPDTTEDRPDAPAASREVAKDLQFYPTPQKVAEKIVSDLYPIEGQRVLEPSCGDGRLLDALRAAGAKPFGIEIDPQRVKACHAKGHRAVFCENFLESVLPAEFDRVVMNPPFYGKHYAKHVRHAFGFLKPGGTLTAILPITARYDHGLLDGSWQDLPVGSFAESGTRINTTVLTMRKPATPESRP